MNKTEIFDNYATKHGHEGWWKLLHYCMKNGNLQYHINAVTDLIQEELKKKIAENFGNEEIQQEIINTEIL